MTTAASSPTGVWSPTVDQGATFARTLRWYDADGALVPLVGKTARMQIRRRIDDETPLVELTSENGGLTLVDPGQIGVLLTAPQTAALPSGSAVYDLEIVDGESVGRLLGGVMKITREVTR